MFGWLKKLFGIGESQNYVRSAEAQSRAAAATSATVATTASTAVIMDEGDLHSGPEGYSPNTAYPDTFYGSGGESGGGYDGGGSYSGDGGGSY